jgi:hypothetical protein
MGASRLGPDLANLNLNVPPPVPIPALTTGRENQYLQRIKELENEVRQCRVENEKNVRTPFGIYMFRPSLQNVEY